jgi:hypothetical protein
VLPLCPLRVGRDVTAVIQVLARTVDPLGSHGLFVQPAGVAPHACDDGSIIRGCWPGFFIGVTGGTLNYILVILIMVCLFMGRVVVRLSRRRAGFHAPAGAFHDRRYAVGVVRSVRAVP